MNNIINVLDIMINLPRIISFSGRKRSGKTELAQICVKYGYILVNFADSLKELICNSLEITRDFLEENKDIHNPQGYDLTCKISYISTETGIDQEIVQDIIKQKFYSIRKILQVFGTDLIRKYNHLWHINKFISKIQKNPNKNFCIGDTRFRNEKEIIETLGGECWFIIRPNMVDNISNHVSEIELQWSNFGDNIIINNIDKETFCLQWSMYLNKGKQIMDNSIYKSCNIEAFLIPTKETSYIMGIISHFENGALTMVKYSNDNFIIDLGEKILQCKNHFLCCANPFIIENSKLWGISSNISTKDIPVFFQNINNKNLDMFKYWVLGLTNKKIIEHETIIVIKSNIQICNYLYNFLGYGKIINNDTIYFENDDLIKFKKWFENIFIE